MGHFARERRAPKNKEGQFGYQDNTRKQESNEDTSSKAMLAIDGVAAAYKRGLATVKEQLITYRKNEFEKVKQEKEGIEFKIEKFDNASKSLNKLLESQITDKSKKGLGYNVVPPPHPLIYNRPKKLDLSYSGLDEFKDPEFKSYGSEDKQVSEDTSNFVESSLNVDKETVFLDKKIEFVKPKNHEKPVKKSVRPKAINTVRPHSTIVNAVRVNQANAVKGKPQQDDTRFIDSGCSRHMTGNIAYLSDFKEFDGGYVTFRHVKRGWDTKIPQSNGLPVKVGDEAIHKELGDRMERAATFASRLEAEQDSGNINRTQSMATLNEPSP
ncbi:hypothetical protein Tco_0617111 [Tanacetum coccineum]